MTTPFPYGPQIQIEVPNSGPLPFPAMDDVAISGLAYGNFIVVWTTPFDPVAGFQSDVRAQIFNGDGSLSGNEFVVAHAEGLTALGPVFTQPDVELLDDEQYVVTWADHTGTGGDPSVSAIMAQKFNLFGPSGPEIEVNTTTDGAQSHPSVSALSGGRFIVSWTDASETGADTSGDAIRAQVFDSFGRKTGAEILVNTSTTGDQIDSAVAELANGRFVVTWTDTQTAEVRAQLFNSDGGPYGTEFLVNTTTDGLQYRPSITELTGGGFVISWSDNNGDASFDGVRAQVFDNNGSPLGADFLVNTTMSSSQFSPAMTALPDGRFVATWTDWSTTGMGDVQTTRGQVFNADGSKSGDEFFVDDDSGAELRWRSDVSTLADGRFVVATWLDDVGISAQMFDPRDSAVDLTGTSRDDYLIGTLFDDRISGWFGDDALWGEAGNDRLFGNDGSDRLYGGPGNDTLWGNTGRDDLFGGDGNDILNGGAGIDLMDGGAGSDTYIVDNVDDVVVEVGVPAGPGSDIVRSSTISLDLHDYFNVNNAQLFGTLDLDVTGNYLNNRLSGNDADNVLWGLRGSDLIFGRAGDDFLIGGYGDDVLLGQDGNDRLFGNSGNDLLNGGVGRDVQTGGAGADVFVFRGVNDSGTTFGTRDQISDFVQGDDKLNLAAIDLLAMPSRDDTLIFIGNEAFGGELKAELRYEHVGSRTHVQADVDGDGVSDFDVSLAGNLSLTEDDFIL